MPEPPSRWLIWGLFAVQLDDIDGRLEPGSPVQLTLPADIGFDGVNPNTARRSSFSRAASGDRLALVASSQTDTVLMTARIDPDAASKITGLSNLVVQAICGRWAQSPPPRRASPATSITLGRKQHRSVHLGQSLDGPSAFRQHVRVCGKSLPRTPMISPSGILIFARRNSNRPAAGPITAGSGGVYLRETDIYSLTLDTRAVTRVTTNRNKGRAALGRNSAMWRSDGAWIGFSAYTSFTPRRSQCSDLVNSEIFLIKADGSTTASQITNTSGTSVEVWPKWGW